MPSMFVVLIAVSVAFIAVLAAVLAAAERQYDSPKSRSTQAKAGPVPPTDDERSVARLAPIIASCINDATRFLPRNSSEAKAIAELRSALRLAVDGDFQAEVRAVLDSLPDVVAMHDVSRSVVGGPTVDHLVVAPGGVTVVRSVVRSAKVSIRSDGVFLGRGREQVRDAVVDDVLRQMAAVVAVVDNVMVHGAILFQDVLTLPAEIRGGNVSLRGVRLSTLSQLESCVLPTGSSTHRPIDVARVAGRLRSGFGSTLPPAGRELHLRRR